MIINGYSLNLCNYRHFLYYLIQNDVKLVDFDKFTQNETETLCNHIDNYIKNNNVEISKSITKRYIEALPDINVDKVPISEINKISSSITIND